MSKHRTRRKRRQAKAALQHGADAKPRHKSKSGRTGSIFSKQLKGRRPKRPDKPKPDTPAPDTLSPEHTNEGS